MLVVPAGSRMLTQLAEPLSARTARPGDTIYFRVASSLVVRGQAVMEQGSFLEATVTTVPERSPAGRLEIGLRVRRLISGNGDVADIFTAGGAPNGSAYRRGVTAIADVSARDQVVTMASTVPLVVENAFTVDSRRSRATALGARIRVVGTPPRVECLVQSIVPTPDVIIPGTPPTSPIGDVPGTPGTPEIVIPGTPNMAQTWQPCR